LIATELWCSVWRVDYDITITSAPSETDAEVVLVSAAREGGSSSLEILLRSYVEPPKSKGKVRLECSEAWGEIGA
jgi:hypothetical protein